MSIPATSRLIDIRGARLGVTDSGADNLPVAISAHGLSQSRAAAIRSSIGDFSVVGQPDAPGGHRRLISYDARGHGESSGSTNPADYTWPNLALDMLALADVFSPNAPVAGIGVSMGTGTLLHAVTHLPNRFDRLVLGAPSTAWHTRALQARMYATMADLFENGSAEQLEATMKSAPIPPIFADVPEFGLQPDVDISLLPAVFRGAGLTDLPSFEAIAGITQPTLILAWATDPGHPLETAEKLRELIPGAELVVSETSADVRSWGSRAAAFLAR